MRFLQFILPSLALGRLLPFDTGINKFDEPLPEKADDSGFLQPLNADPFLGLNYHSGYINVDNKGGEMFYWYVPRREEVASSPWIVWLTGGPGCSSELAAMTENGPLTINESGSVSRNAHSWNEAADVVYVDQPLGTGFSSGGVPVTNEKAVAKDFRPFLEGLIDLYPKLKNRPFFITGESYAGHYIPAIAALLVEEPIDGLDFQGVAIGNGWVDPENQYPAYAKFAYEHNLISQVEFRAAEAALEGCVKLIEKGLWPIALVTCNTIVSQLIKGKNPYDIRLDCEVAGSACYNTTSLSVFMNQPEVQKALGVHRQWRECSPVVYALLVGDWMTDLRKQVTKLLEKGIKVLIYSGDQDFICNWRGGQAWVDKIEWDSQDEFKSQKFESWTVNGKSVGEFKSVKNFKFLRIYDAGHMVPMDQPSTALAMITDFIKSTPAATKEFSILSRERLQSFAGNVMMVTM